MGLLRGVAENRTDGSVSRQLRRRHLLYATLKR
jgi:hypothetical protein